jgi:osmotically-inducible protein OsmY
VAEKELWPHKPVTTKQNRKFRGSRPIGCAEEGDRVEESLGQPKSKEITTEVEAMKKIISPKLGMVGSLSLGAGLMYLLDPALGRRRRAVARDKMTHFTRKTSDAFDASARDLKNRGYGIFASTRRWFSKNDVSDGALTDRVRSELGYLVSHPSSIEVTTKDGMVQLSGPVLAHEVDRLVNQVARIRGVKNVENRLEARESSESIPALQGRPNERTGRRFDILQTHWSPATRLLVGTAAGASLAYAAKRRDLIGAAVALMGGGMLSRALTNIEFKRRLNDLRRS